MRNLHCCKDKRQQLPLPVELGDVTHFAVDSDGGVLFVAGSGLGVAAYRAADCEVNHGYSSCRCGQAGDDRGWPTQAAAAAAAATAAAAAAVAAAAGGRRRCRALLRCRHRRRRRRIVAACREGGDGDGSVCDGDWGRGRCRVPPTTLCLSVQYPPHPPTVRVWHPPTPPPLGLPAPPPAPSPLPVPACVCCRRAHRVWTRSTTRVSAVPTPVCVCVQYPPHSPHLPLFRLPPPHLIFTFSIRSSALRRRSVSVNVLCSLHTMSCASRFERCGFERNSA